MTTEEFEPLGHFMGWHKSDDAWHKSHWWGKNPNGTLRYISAGDKTSLTPAECYEALDRLVKKDLSVSISGGPLGWTIATVDRDYHDTCVSAPTIHEAIEQALLQIAAKEG